jgi:hypothetical protein
MSLLIAAREASSIRAAISVSLAKRRLLRREVDEALASIPRQL